MKGIETLIKMHQRELDALRRQSVHLEEQRQKLIDISAKLHRQVMEERQMAAENPMMAGYMGDFEKKMQQRQLDIAKQVVLIDQELAQLSAAIAESFGELKKYEITRDNERERGKARADRREQEMLDEVGIQQFSRKDDSNK